MIDIDQEADYVPKRPIRWSIVLAVAGIVVSIIATIALMGGQLDDVVPTDSKRPGRIDADAFTRTTAAERMRAAADQRLERYGWVDRASGTIHVPLEVAIEHYLGGRK